MGARRLRIWRGGRKTKERKRKRKEKV